jgi:hypothetical protein
MSTSTQPRQPSGTPVGGQFAGKANPEPDVELSGDLAAAIRPNQQLYYWLEDVRSRLDAGERPDRITGPFGTHGVVYGEEDGEEYAVIGFALPDGIFAEVDEGAHTYGELYGFRVFIKSQQDVPSSPSAHSAVPEPSPTAVGSDRRVGLPPEVIKSALWFTGHAIRDYFDEDVDDLSDEALEEISRKVRNSPALYAGYEDAMDEALAEWRDEHRA